MTENNSTKKDIKVIGLDLDGTLLDSMPMWHGAADRYLINKGLVPEKNLWDKVKALTTIETAVYFTQHYDINLSPEKIKEEILKMILDEYRYNLKLKDGVLDFLNRLESKNIPVALATATDRDVVLTCLERLKIREKFKVIHSCIELNTSKSEPLIYRQCAFECGAEPEETCVFEDALHCVRTAKNAGFKVVAVYDKSSEEISEPPESDWNRIIKISDFNIKSMKEISL